MVGVVCGVWHTVAPVLPAKRCRGTSRLVPATNRESVIYHLDLPSQCCYHHLTGVCNFRARYRRIGSDNRTASSKCHSWRNACRCCALGGCIDASSGVVLVRFNDGPVREFTAGAGIWNRGSPPRNSDLPAVCRAERAPGGGSAKTDAVAAGGWCGGKVPLVYNSPVTIKSSPPLERVSGLKRLSTIPGMLEWLYRC